MAPRAVSDGVDLDVARQLGLDRSSSMGAPRMVGEVNASMAVAWVVVMLVVVVLCVARDD